MDLCNSRFVPSKTTSVFPGKANPFQVSAISTLFAKKVPLPLLVDDPNANGHGELLLSLMLSLLVLLLLLSLLLPTNNSDSLLASIEREVFSMSAITASVEPVVTTLVLLATVSKSVLSSSQSILPPSELLTVALRWSSR